MPEPKTPARSPWLIGGLAFANACAVVLSFRGLFNYAGAAGIPRWLAWLYPPMLDLPLIAAEIVLLTAATAWRKTAAWIVIAGFGAVSMVANMDTLPAVWGKGLPPAVVAVVLWFALGEVKHPTPQTRAARQPEVDRELASTPRRPSTKQSTGRGKPLNPAAEQQAAADWRDHGRPLGLSQRKFATVYCGGNRPMAQRAMASNGHQP